MEMCIGCGRPLTGGERVLPWEDGDNPDAYIRCPHCGCKNFRYGFGEEDD